MKKRIRVSDLILYSGFLLAVGITLLFGFWGLYPYNPVDFDRPTLEILNCPCTPGDTVQYHISGTNNGTYHVTISKSIVNGHITTYEPVHEFITEGDFDFTAEVYLPTSVDPGLAKIRVSMQFNTNPLSPTFERIESDYFEVIEILDK